MRVLQVHTKYREQGGEDVVVDAERALLERGGHEVFRHEVTNPAGALGSMRNLVLSPWNPLAAAAATRVANAVRPDVVHVHNTWFSMSPAVVAAFSSAGYPTVATLHNYRLFCSNGLLLRDGRPCEDCLGRSPIPAIVHRCYRDSTALSAVAAANVSVHRRLGTWVRHVDRFIAFNSSARDRVVAAGLPRERVALSEHFVDAPGRGGPRPSESTDVLFVGRLSSEKGIDDLLEAWRMAKPSNLRLFVVGDGPQRERLERDRPKGVEVVGQVPHAHVLSLMLAARAIVIPSHVYEMGPLVALEGLAAGRPLVVTDVMAIADAVGAAGAGWSVPAGDRSALAGVLAHIAGASAVDDAGKSAYSLYQDRYSPAVALASLEQIYEDARANRVVTSQIDHRK